MQSLEQIFTQYNPVDHQKPVGYAVFLSRGVLPFTSQDLQSLWDEWRSTTVPGAAPSTTPGYGPHWRAEREKFFNMFQQFAALEVSGKKSTLCAIYPNGQELLWTPQQVTTIIGKRGPLLASTLQTLKADGDFALGLCLQYAFQDAPGLYQVPVTRDSPQHTIALSEAVSRVRLDNEYKANPTFLTEPLPVAAIAEFWSYYRSHSAVLTQKYGSERFKPTPLFNRYQHLFEAGGFRELFDRFTALDAQVNKDKLLMASFIYDTGFQYVLYRLGGQSHKTSGTVFKFSKLPATEGTKWLVSRAPANVRMIIKTLYVEQ